jgi:heme/copper-type cytochrome/quinol oxidase subunit 1
MALGGAAIIGGLAGFLVPWMAQATTDSFNRLVQAGTIAIPVGSNHLMWSWPTFIIVTFLGWLLLKASE